VERNLLSVEENSKATPNYKIINSEMDGYKKTSGRNKKKNIIGNDQIHIDSQLKSNRQKSYGSNMSMFPSAIQFNK